MISVEAKVNPSSFQYPSMAEKAEDGLNKPPTSKLPLVRHLGRMEVGLIFPRLLIG